MWRACGVRQCSGGAPSPMKSADGTMAEGLLFAQPRATPWETIVLHACPAQRANGSSEWLDDGREFAIYGNGRPSNAWGQAGIRY